MPCALGPDVTARIVLVGDAGSPRPEGDRVLAAARDCLFAAGSVPSALWFLGDNVYGNHTPTLRSVAHGGPYGGFVPGHPREEAQLAAQVGLAAEGRSFLIAGNHDWYAGHAGLRAEAEASGAHWRGGTGCDDLRVDFLPLGDVWVVAFDSMAAFRCGRDARATLRTELGRTVRAAPGLVILAAHHPRVTVGDHARGHLSQDLHTPRYRRYLELLQTATDQADGPVLIASGHDHLLAWLPLSEGPVLGQIVTGAGSEDVRLDRRGEVRRGGDAEPAVFTEVPGGGQRYDGRGFVVVDILTAGGIALQMIGADGTASEIAVQRR